MRHGQTAGSVFKSTCKQYAVCIGVIVLVLLKRLRKDSIEAKNAKKKSKKFQYRIIGTFLFWRSERDLNSVSLNLLPFIVRYFIHFCVISKTL